jgi:hypothetical protein
MLSRRLPVTFRLIASQSRRRRGHSSCGSGKNDAVYPRTVFISEASQPVAPRLGPTEFFAKASKPRRNRLWILV